MTTMEQKPVEEQTVGLGIAKSTAQSIYYARIASRDDPSTLPWLNQLLKHGISDLDHVENPMYLRLLAGRMSTHDIESFLQPYYWGSSQGFNKEVLPAALKANDNASWRVYIKSIIREENMPSCHCTMFRNFVQSIGCNVGERPEIARHFVDKLIAGYSSRLGFALGYALGIETEADFQIAVIHAALSSTFPVAIGQDEFFTIHMDETGEEAHAKATCDAIAELITSSAINAGEVRDGFNSAILDTREFVCDIYKILGR